LAAKLLVICPTAKPIHALTTYIFNLARYDEDWDVRDRSRFLRVLLRSIFQTSTADDIEGNGLPDSEEGDVGGVVLRREQIRMVLLAAKETVASETGAGK
jgi:AP-3 complex subunit beta